MTEQLHFTSGPLWGFPDGLVVKNLPVNAGDTGDMDWEDLEESIATHFSILAWIIPCAEEPGRLKSIASQRVRHT